MSVRHLLLGLALLGASASVAYANCNCDEEPYCLPFIAQTATMSWVTTAVDGESVAEETPSLQLTANADGTVTLVFDGLRQGGYVLAPVVDQ
jgi:hypothetical protein